ncbi:MAG: hypothetical protein OXC14_11655 [Rhodospirillaceae bacterium]|nr:hypothetical protein [Rhodospirillaceae bacterium]
MNRFLAPTALGGLLALAGCGGGGGTSAALTDAERERIASDPRVVRLGNVLERADTLLVPTLHLRYSLSAEGHTLSDRQALGTDCSGTRCDVADGSEITVEDLFDPATEIDLTGVSIGSRDGFDTIAARGGVEITENIPDGTITSAPTITAYGIWGEHGFASVEISDGSVSGSLEGVPFTGDFGSATAYAVGDASGTNPEGTGSATWSGVAEAASTGTFQRRRGSATVTIADLSRPRAGVEIDVPGFAIDSPAWSDMPLVDGGFASGSAGTDRLEGNFHGPDHGEAWGVFDTGAYVGAFGAKRVP